MIMTIKKFFKSTKNKIKDFFKDEWGGNLVEYALLIGFALFIFFIIVGVVTSLMDSSFSEVDGLFEDLG